MNPEEQVPFSTRVLGEKLPKGYKPPAIGEYDGSQDPEDHLRKFRNVALLHQYSDAIKCRVFFNTLFGSAEKWFDGLSNGSITCFQDFKTVFMRHFASSRKYQKIDHCLFALKQGSAEPLRIEGKFFRDLIRDPVKNFNEILGKAASYINVEEVQTARRKADKVSTSTNKLEKKAPQPPAHPLPSARDVRPPFGSSLDTRLVLHVAAVQVPKPGSWGPRYYTYHRSHTHASSDYFQFT
ncbi:uncharacterized protein LOC121999362 [Zingiber officinale]|uniref:uncharacterized protein LOC121999362 n=1 Tax=Zingiber officinale TaxID=94328 RepID=UPI001C4B1972|nr:uncharacterized protein LOC121999362 [Zingiber officinale]